MDPTPPSVPPRLLAPPTPTPASPTQPAPRIELNEPTEDDANSNNGQKSPLVRDPRVVYADDRADDLLEKEFAAMGIKLMKKFNRNNMVKNFNKRITAIKENRPAGATLHSAIETMDMQLTDFLLVEMGPQKAFDELRRENSLHKLLIKVYHQQKEENGNGVERQDSARQIEQIVRIVVGLVQHEILIVQHKETSNTLLHCAINTQDPRLVGFLLKMGSPVHVRNCNEMTAVELCVVLKNAHLLELVLRHGGSFHHILTRGVVDGISDHRGLFPFLNRQTGPEIEEVFKVLEEHRKNVQEACDKVRTKLLASRLIEHAFGPLVSFPRGNLKHSCYQQTVQFVIPADWSEKRNAKFMLAVIPMAFDSNKNVFVGSGKKVSLECLPRLSGEECRPMTKMGIFFRATSALQKHFRKVLHFGHRYPYDKDFANFQRCGSFEAREQFVKNRNMNTYHPRLCTLSLHFDPKEVFQFVVCQLILYEPDKSILQAASTSTVIDGQVLEPVASSSEPRLPLRELDMDGDFDYGEVLSAPNLAATPREDEVLSDPEDNLVDPVLEAIEEDELAPIPVVVPEGISSDPSSEEEEIEERVVKASTSETPRMRLRSLQRVQYEEEELEEQPTSTLPHYANFGLAKRRRRYPSGSDPEDREWGPSSIYRH